jgi:hypothetical protein
MVVAEGDDHTMWDLEIDAFAKIPTPKKRLNVVKTTGHHGLYRDTELISGVGADCARWFAEWL